MKRFLGLIALCSIASLLLAQSVTFPGPGSPHSAGASPSLVQTKSCSGNSPLTCNLSAATTAGSSIALTIHTTNATITCVGSGSTITSTPSNTFTQATVTSGGTGGMSCGAYSMAVATGTNAIVVTGSGGSLVNVSMFEMANVTAFDQTGNAIASSATCSIPTSGSVTAATEEVIAQCADWNNYNTWTAGSGYTIREQIVQNDSTGTYTGATEDNNTKTGLSGVQTATFTKSVNAGWTGVIMTFK